MRRYKKAGQRREEGHETFVCPSGQTASALGASDGIPTKIQVGGGNQETSRRKQPREGEIRKKGTRKEPRGSALGARKQY